MRLWHYKLIPLLPKEMLVSQWRECIAIKRQWEKGTLKHRLVSYVLDHDKDYFIHYVDMVVNELGARNIKYQSKYYDEIRDFCNPSHYIGGKFYPEHNERYLFQCLYNLEEKHDRGIISDKEWDPIEEKWQEIIYDGWDDAYYDY